MSPLQSTSSLHADCNTPPSTMSVDRKQEPYCNIPVQAPVDVPLYPIRDTPERNSVGDGKSVVNGKQKKLGRFRGMTTCTSCHEQVLTNIDYKVGLFAKQMCVLFVILGLLTFPVALPLIPLPFYMKWFKDAHHTCPICHRELHVEKKRCCQC